MGSSLLQKDLHSAPELGRASPVPASRSTRVEHVRLGSLGTGSPYRLVHGKFPWFQTQARSP